MNWKQYHLESIAHAYTLVSEDPSAQWPIDALAQEVRLDRTTLQTGFKERYGLSIHALQIQKRIEAAKNLLENTELSMKEIAHRCGYKSASRFSQAFKETTGVTPTAWRNDRQKTTNCLHISLHLQDAGKTG